VREGSKDFWGMQYKHGLEIGVKVKSITRSSQGIGQWKDLKGDPGTSKLVKLVQPDLGV
jgi:hypothetical protein